MLSLKPIVLHQTTTKYPQHAQHRNSLDKTVDRGPATRTYGWEFGKLGDGLVRAPLLPLFTPCAKCSKETPAS